MNSYFKFSYGIALVGLLTTACQKEDIQKPALNPAHTAVLMGNEPYKPKPSSQQNIGSSRAYKPDRSPSPSSRSYQVHKALVEKGGYSPNTYQNAYDKNFNDYYKEYNNLYKEPSDY